MFLYPEASETRRKYFNDKEKIGVKSKRKKMFQPYIIV